MGRAFKHHPEIKEMYQTLLDSEKVRFRQAWAASRSWDFVNFERSTVSSYRRNWVCSKHNCKSQAETIGLPSFAVLLIQILSCWGFAVTQHGSEL